MDYVANINIPKKKHLRYCEKFDDVFFHNLVNKQILSNGHIISFAESIETFFKEAHLELGS